MSTISLLHEFTTTLAACHKLLDALHLVLQVTAKLGIPRAALCLSDPIIDNKLVVRLTFGMAGAVTKVLAPSAPGAVAAFCAVQERRIIQVAHYASSPYQATNLEEWLRVTTAVHVPILASAPAALGVLIAIPNSSASITPTTLMILERICTYLGAQLPRLVPLALPLPAEPAPPWHTELFTALRTCLNTPDLDALSHLVLEHCRAVTHSEFGFVGYIDAVTGFLITPTMTRNIFAQCQVAGKTVVFEKPSGLGGWVLDNRMPLIANDPFAHPVSVGTPPGHLPIRKFMGVPCLSQGRVLGMIALANKTSDYDHHDLQRVTAFADVYAAAVARFISERELTESRNRFASLYENAPCCYHTLAPDGQIVEINETALALLGRRREDLVGCANINALLTHTGQKLFAQQLQALKQGTAAPVELYFKSADGSRVPVLHSATLITDPRGFPLTIRCTSIDLRQHRQAEARIRSLNRIYAVLSGINCAVVRLRDPALLYHEACRIAVEVGGFQMAWLGAVDAQSGALQPLAHAGAVADYLDQLQLSLRDDTRQHGPTLLALEHGQAVVCNDIATDPCMEPWRERALALGYRSSAAFPLRISGTVRGTFNLYAATPGFFDIKELRLLNELTQDLSFGLEFIDNERQRKQAEEAVRYQKEVLDRTGRLAKVGGWEFDVTTHTGSWTEETARIQDLPPDTPATVAQGLNLFHGVMRTQLEQAVQQAITQAQPYDLELEMMSARGVHKWVRTIGLPVVEGGQVVRIEGAMQDISRRKRAQLEARQNAILLDSVFQVLPDLFFLVDPDGTICDYRASHDEGLYVPPSTFLGRRFRDVLPLDVALQFEKCIEQIIAHGRLVSCHYELPMPNGIRQFEARLNQLPDSHQFIAVVRDVTERKRAEAAVIQLNAELEERVAQRTAELATINKELETFTYSVSHDLKAPLRGIDGYSRLLIEEHWQHLNEEGQLFLRNVRRGVAQMGQLIEDLLAYSRMERREMQGISLDLLSLLECIIAERTDELYTSNAKVHLQFDTRPLVQADPDGLALVLRNVLDNALKFHLSDRPPIIEFSASAMKQHLVVAVKDNGIGFAMQFHDRIFEMFQRLQPADEYPGTGIGLAIVRKALTRMGGHIWAASVPGQGTTFFIKLPLCAQP
ncbi:GAF domain-containing protein [Chromatium okenii]|uniref:GAF domain-containing protein n=1 Tax=Chromatium okenii TaxID=61644 RepID=UPI0019051A28|nr:GAF domain-containing protein [Chromatium okenii]